jgi:hypothetical protein
MIEVNRRQRRGPSIAFRRIAEKIAQFADGPAGAPLLRPAFLDGPAKPVRRRPGRSLRFEVDRREPVSQRRECFRQLTGACRHPVGAAGLSRVAGIVLGVVPAHDLAR